MGEAHGESNGATSITLSRDSGDVELEMGLSDREREILLAGGTLNLLVGGS